MSPCVLLICWGGGSHIVLPGAPVSASPVHSGAACLRDNWTQFSGLFISFILPPISALISFSCSDSSMFVSCWCNKTKAPKEPFPRMFLLKSTALIRLTLYLTCCSSLPAADFQAPPHLHCDTAKITLTLAIISHCHTLYLSNKCGVKVIKFEGMMSHVWPVVLVQMMWCRHFVFGEELTVEENS